VKGDDHDLFDGECSTILVFAYRGPAKYCSAVFVWACQGYIFHLHKVFLYNVPCNLKPICYHATKMFCVMINSFSGSLPAASAAACFVAGSTLSGTLLGEEHRA
jgi:hypothetical protein